MKNKNSIFKKQFELLKRQRGSEWLVFEDYIDQSGEHPSDYRHFECGFAAAQISSLNPKTIVDVGSNRLFIAGLTASRSVISVDFRSRKNHFTNETVLTSNGRNINLPDNSADLLISLNAIEHFGLGRYGDPFDIEADHKAFLEFKRIVRLGGHIVFSTTINKMGSAIAFNAHRIYNRKNILSFCVNLTCIAESFFCTSRNEAVNESKLIPDPKRWDVYAGCWMKT